MKTSIRLLVLSLTLAATSSIYAGEGAAYWAQRSPSASVAKSTVTTPSAAKTAAENTAPRPYERGAHSVSPRTATSAGCACAS